MEIGSIIRSRRAAQGLTQEQVAQALGVTATAVSKWERNTSLPEITLLPALAVSYTHLTLPTTSRV